MHLIVRGATRSDSGPPRAADFEFVNGHPVKDPGTIWLHTYHSADSQGEHGFAPSRYQAITGRRSSIADKMHTYTVDWQPGHVSW